ncbi:hypothetical protein Taro_039126, partial [Colocasia esculenta]|nr:hypothetical protein [Colocasia esculenta]
VGELPPSFSGILEHGGADELMVEQWSGVVEQGGGSRVVMKAHLGSVLRLPLFEFITYLIGLSSNPFGSSDPWVAARPSGSLAGGPGGRVVTVVSELRGLVRCWPVRVELLFDVASFPARFKCELQESVAAITGCACYERGCWFARAAVEFVVGLHIRVGVSLRLGEPTCGVAFTGAGLWSAEPVEGVLASLAIPLLLGCVLCWLCVWPRMPVRHCALCSPQSMLVCRVAPLVERCYTYLWLLSALCWLVVNFGELLPKFFSVGSGGSEVSPELCCAHFWLLLCCPRG